MSEWVYVGEAECCEWGAAHLCVAGRDRERSILFPVSRQVAEKHDGAVRVAGLKLFTHGALFAACPQCRRPYGEVTELELAEITGLRSTVRNQAMRIGQLKRKAEKMEAAGGDACITAADRLERLRLAAVAAITALRGAMAGTEILRSRATVTPIDAGRPEKGRAA